MWSVIIDSIPEHRVRFIKVLRRETAATLKAAEDTYNRIGTNLPYELMSGLEWDDAERIGKAISEAGADVQIKPGLPFLATDNIREDNAKPGKSFKPRGVYRKDSLLKRFGRVRNESVRRFKMPIFWLPLLVSVLIALDLIVLRFVLISPLQRQVGWFLVGPLVLFSSLAWVSIGVARLRTWRCTDCGHVLQGPEEPKTVCQECGSD
ncbi:MAG: ribosomal protein L7/L12, partial [Phycisphaerales bacterium]|nr:ribosomal protein L7/L12 [Phycisphaerales bacterium]